MSLGENNGGRIMVENNGIGFAKNKGADIGRIMPPG